MNENSRTCVRVWSVVRVEWGWGMDARTGAAGYNFTIKIEVQLLGPGVGNGAISATIKICKKRSILHQGIFEPNCQFGPNFLFLLLGAGCLCRWGLFTDFFAVIKYVVNGLISVG